jgi:hypothetical protein
MNSTRCILASIAIGAVTAGVIAGCSSPQPPPAASSPTVTTTPAAGGVKPTVVLVHGAWADNSSWDGEVTELQ